MSLMTISFRVRLCGRSIDEWIEILFWRILKRSVIFRYWYRRQVNEFLYDLEICDVNPEEMRDKWIRRREGV